MWRATPLARAASATAPDTARLQDTRHGNTKEHVSALQRVTQRAGDALRVGLQRELDLRRGLVWPAMQDAGAVHAHDLPNARLDENVAAGDPCRAHPID